MRLIDADTLLEKVEKIQPWGPYLGKYAQGIRHCMELVGLLIEDAPTIEPEQRWIPCSERLPESTDYYLVTVGINEYGLMIPSVRTALYNVKTKDWTIHTGTNMCIVGDVVAWCDCLLEPYREEGESDEND